MLINLIIFLAIIREPIKALELIHNKGNFIDTLEIYSSKFPRSFTQNPHRNFVSTQILRPSILKIYQPNVTLDQGDKLSLNCPFTSGNIKTIIWTKEFRAPKIISHNHELYSKNSKYSLIESNYSLQVCPVGRRDSGWYSCYVVKKTLYEQNVKYFVYVKVLGLDDGENDDYEYTDDLIPDKCKNLPSTTPGAMDTSLKRQIGTEIIARKTEEKIFDLSIGKSSGTETESLQVSPRYLMVNESSSFQLQCFYSGPNYLHVRLKWFKNEKELKENMRFVLVDYITNRSVLRIVKFSFAVKSDSGQYKCVAYTNSKEILFQKTEKSFSFINVNCKS
ncbi:hypothetical protein BpHYR1_033586 [Brachionus plicatilis]|uniref:Ig-like domain-containing protein n=1 Tax=Brachionus plicatilis TaxID=10195 RepID=A0A3M7RIY5_BRAPC|nr:hypothetical protein BpHYR1_033586 [Brachionus plicatilis]